MHRILLEEEAQPVRQPQRQLKPTIINVVKKEDMKLLVVGIIYPNNWRVYIDDNKLKQVTHKDHFPSPFIDQVLERRSPNVHLLPIKGLHNLGPRSPLGNWPQYSAPGLEFTRASANTILKHYGTKSHQVSSSHLSPQEKLDAPMASKGGFSMSKKILAHHFDDWLTIPLKQQHRDEFISSLFGQSVWTPFVN
ncbi:hypothetical protein CR513_35066, partial [Mucuna pruriens]